ncbi:MAG: hypothetical protein JOY68_07010 [Candidatus Dormibacteraeota bacterium]|nr:hypothetical protein [Candidatus Dormibacteraeota bacterium]
MDNRTGFRRGPAYLAEQARQALGVVAESRPLAEIPPPLVHTAFGAAICGLAVALRSEVLGLRGAAVAGGALAAGTALVLVVYDRLVYSPGRRPSPDAVALPVAAVVAFVTVLAGVSQLGVRLAAGIVAALVIGGVPQVLWRQVTGGGAAYRFFRDIAGIVVLAPVMVAGVSTLLPPWPRVGLVALAVFLVSYDGLRNEPLSAVRAAAGALVTAAATALAARLAGASVPNAGECAALLLVLWYGLRGVSAVLVSAEMRRGYLTLVEYAAFVGVAAGALRLVVLNQ